MIAYSVLRKVIVSFSFTSSAANLHLCLYKVIGDITKDSTLIPEYFKGVKKVINAASVIVGPKEGDTPDRSKYSQVCPLALLRQQKFDFSSAVIHAYLSLRNGCVNVDLYQPVV